MTEKEMIKIIQENSLTVRCLPHKVINNWSYKEGDEERIKIPSYDSKGKLIDTKKSIVFDESTGRKYVREERDVDKGGWWFVQETHDTMSIVRFSNKHDFFAPTLGEALQLYLDSKNK